MGMPSWLFLPETEIMSRLQQIFKSRPSGEKKGFLNIYCTAGFPQLESTLPVMKALQDSGADMIELGMPYSDPLADGLVIQHSNALAISNGMTIVKLLEQLSGFRKEIHVPVILMGYMNPILQYGFERFCNHAADAGVDALIIPDLPVHEFETSYGVFIKNVGLDFIFLVTPETPAERLHKLDQLSSGFLYAVSSSSVTGSSGNMDEVEIYLKDLKKMNLRNPVLVGFGISDKKSFERVCSIADGAIIGSAYINALQKGPDVPSATIDFIRSIII